MRRPASILMVMAGAVLLLWTALVNGRPAVFTDTALYYSEGVYVFEALGLARPATAGDPAGDPTRLPDHPGARDISAAIDGARAPTYAAFLYGLQRLGGLWLVAYTQALAVAAVVFALYRAAAPHARRSGYLVLMAGLAALTPLAPFAAFAMPDVFAGVAAAGVMLVMIWNARLSWATRLGVLSATAFALSVHRSNLLDGGAVTLLAAGLLIVAGERANLVAGRVAWVAGTCALAVLVGAGLHAVVQRRAGEPVGAPPFLSARVIADGPGRAYLRTACGRDAEAWALCPYAGEPLATSDQILWSNKRVNAVFVAASPTVRLAMERQDARFALASTLADPWGQARASLANVARQFVSLAVDDALKRQDYYVREPYWRRTALPAILPGEAACVARAGCPGVLSPVLAEVLEGLGLAASIAFLVWRLSAPDLRCVFTKALRSPARAALCGGPGDRERIVILLVVVSGLLVVNAAVCGVLSGPFARYQSRLVWLLPACAGLIVAATGLRRPQTIRNTGVLS